MIGTNLAITTKTYVPLGGASTDADAQAFITAAGITNATQQSAVNQLVLDLKGYSIWTKMKAIYPIVGGTATTHKWNLKDPRDLDAAFRLTFATGYTHSSNGMLPNGTSAYADTKFKPSVNGMTTTSGHISIYSRTNVEQTSCDFGSSTSPGVGAISAPEQVILTRYTALGFVSVYGDYNSNLQVANANSQGFYITNRNSATNTTGYKNGVRVINAAATSGLANLVLVISAETQNGAPGISRYSTRQIAFASIGDGLTDTEAANFYTAVQNYQTTLARQV